MAYISPSELTQKLKAGELCRGYYLYGRDISTVEKGTKAILKKHLGKGYESAATKLGGEGLDVSALIDILEQCPMFSEWNAVLINDLNAEQLTADELKLLTKEISELPDNTLLIVNITGFDVKNGKKSMTAKNKKLADSISKVGVVCECELKTKSVLAKEIAARVQKQGCTISKQSAELLAEMCSCDSLAISNELEKLCAYRENDEIRQEDIEELVSAGVETDAFRLSRAIVSNNSAAAMDILNYLIESREEPVYILSAVSMVFIDLYRARAAMTADKREADVIEDFGYGGRKFAVGNAFRDSRRISQESLRKCVQLLRTADRRLKQNGAIPSVILERTVTEMLIAVRRK